VLERIPVALECRSARDELLEADADVRPCPLVAVAVLDREGAVLGHRLDEQARVPLALRLDAHVQRQAALVDRRRLRAADDRLAPEVVAPVAEDERLALDAAVVLALLAQGVLDFEQVGEVGRRLDAKRQLERLGVVVEHRDVFVDPVADQALADQRDRVPAGNGQEELRREVLRLVPREHPRPGAVDGQQPAREEARVAKEEAVRLVGRGVHVSARVADEERAAVEDADRVGDDSRSSRTRDVTLAAVEEEGQLVAALRAFEEVRQTIR
jgi:hypothetical protein